MSWNEALPKGPEDPRPYPRIFVCQVRNRPDVTLLITFAGNLDHDYWTSYHNVPPLTVSENPANQIASLRNIPQRHFVGGTDRVIPPELARRFAGRLPPDRRPQVIVEGDFDHRCCRADIKIGTVS